MNLDLGSRLKIRSSIHVAAEPLPLFWPMRTFIHHNPLHALETMPFDEAVRYGERLFGGRVFLSREAYQAYLADGEVDRAALAAAVEAFSAAQDVPAGVDLPRWLMALLVANGLLQAALAVALALLIRDAFDLLIVAAPDAGGLSLMQTGTGLLLIAVASAA